MAELKFFLYSIFFLSIVLVISFSYNGCSDSIVNTGSGTNQLFFGYSDDEAGITMTLSAIAYVQENNTNVLAMRDSIIRQLTQPNYATGGKWKLAWGPGVSPGRGNMMFVAVDSTADTMYYAIAIRGSDFKFPSNIEQDMLVWNLYKYPYGTGTGDSVAQGSLYGLDTLLHLTDPLTHKTLAEFLDTIPHEKNKMYITGHSLGGALTTMLSAWFIDMNYTNYFALEAYTFASPSVGNETFVNRYHSIMLAIGGQSHRVVNTRDLVPYGYAGIHEIVPNNIPTTVPAGPLLIFAGIDIYFQFHGIKYKDVETKKDIGTLTPFNCPPGINDENYFCWVGFEHSHNNYLKLLHADTIVYH